jgi:hypothetical protein
MSTEIDWEKFIKSHARVLNQAIRFALHDRDKEVVNALLPACKNKKELAILAISLADEPLLTRVLEASNFKSATYEDLLEELGKGWSTKRLTEHQYAALSVVLFNHAPLKNDIFLQVLANRMDRGEAFIDLAIQLRDRMPEQYKRDALSTAEKETLEKLLLGKFFTGDLLNEAKKKLAAL